VQTPTFVPGYIMLAQCVLPSTAPAILTPRGRTFTKTITTTRNGLQRRAQLHATFTWAPANIPLSYRFLSPEIGTVV
jgi:hypothetical protein